MPKHKLYSIKKSSLPSRQAEWFIQDDFVRIKIPKFYGRMGKLFCRLLRRNPHITLNLDPLGSFVWEKCDGRHSVEKILCSMEKHFDEEGLEERLVQFLYDLEKNDLISFMDSEKIMEGHYIP
jgi:hypothetical protein